MDKKMIEEYKAVFELQEYKNYFAGLEFGLEIAFEKELEKDENFKYMLPWDKGYEIGYRVGRESERIRIAFKLLLFAALSDEDLIEVTEISYRQLKELKELKNNLVGILLSQRSND